MPPKPRTAENCCLCERALLQQSPVRTVSREQTLFSCAHCSAPNRSQWHVACVRNHLKDDSRVFIECARCERETEFRRQPNIFWRTCKLLWMERPQPPKWIPLPVRFCLAVAYEVLTFIVGILALTLTRVYIPQGGKYYSGMGEKLAYEDFPREFARIRFDATNVNNPQMICAMLAAQYILGVVALSAIRLSVGWPLRFCRRGSGRQAASGIEVF